MPSHTEEERKKNRDRIQKLREERKPVTEEEKKKRESGGREFVGLREKALARGASKEEAVALASRGVTRPQERTVEEAQQSQAALGQQIEEEAARKQPFVEAVAAESSQEIDRLQNLARAGLIPFKTAINFAGKGLGFEITEETTEQIAVAPVLGDIFAAVGFATTAGVTIGGVKISAATLFGRQSEISALKTDTSDLREISEATLRSARDSQDYASAIIIYETIIESNRFKHANMQDLLRENPNSVAAGVSDAASMLRDQNRLIGDLGILQRAEITGDPSELNRRVIAIELKGGNENVEEVN